MASREQHDEPHAELRELLARLTEGELAADERARLGEMLRHDKQARSLYRQYMSVHAALDWVLRPTDASPSKGDPVALPTIDTTANPVTPPPVRRRKLRDRFADQIEPDKHLLHFAAVVAFITLGSWAYFIEFVSKPAFHHDDVARVVPKESKEPEEPEPEARFIARLVDTSGTEWGESERWRAGDGLSLGDTLELKKGLAEIRYDHGVRVILQGPALFEIGGEKGGRLSRGRLVARVLEKGKGFIVETPTTLVVDVGTEFGVSVDARGNTDAQVLEGEVRVYLIAEKKSRGTVLVAGEAVTVGAEGRSIIQKPIRTTFVRSMHQTDSVLVNGDFQLPDVAARTMASDSPTGWTFTGPADHYDGDVHGHNMPALSSPKQYVVFNDSGAAVGETVFQTFDTAAGQRYVVSFQMANMYGLEEGGVAEIRGDVFDGSATSGTALGSRIDSRDTVGLNSQVSFDFTAVSETSTLVFTDVSSAGLKNIDTGLVNASVRPRIANDATLDSSPP